MIQLKHAYETPARTDGTRVLVERLWPRGIKKEALDMDDWPKDVAPSSELRRWYAHKPERYAEFAKQYRRELNHKPQAWKPLLAAAKRGSLTLLFAAHDGEHSSARVLRDYLVEHEPH